MAEFKYGVTGKERKAFVGAVSEILNQPKKYLGTPSYGFQVGDYIIDREGTLIGEHSMELLLGLIARGYIQTDTSLDALDEAQETETTPNAEATEPEMEKPEETPSQPSKRDLPRLYTLDTPRGEIYIAEEFASRDEATIEGYGEYFTTAMGTIFSYGDDYTFALVTSHKAGDWDKTTIKRDFRTEEPTELEAEKDSISITLPLDGFNPDSLDNLCKMVTAKEPLIKKALGVDAIPIRMVENGIDFPWFTAEHSNDMMAYAQFITALCATAKEKKRVTAKPQETFENERFTMRVWLIGLGLVGGEYGRIRKLLTSPLSGNGAWRYGLPEKEAVEEAASEAEISQGETPADETPSDDEVANVAADNADTADVEGEVLA